MVATDVSALFPSMDAREAGKACREKIVESGLEFEDCNYDEMLLYVMLNRERTEASKKLYPFFPRRTKTGGKAPGMKSGQVRGPNLMSDLGHKSKWKPRTTP